MSYQRTHNSKASENAAGPTCVYLRSKAIYVTGDLQPGPGEAAGNEYCWCNLTQHVYGPDDRPVARAACMAGRDCFRTTR